MPSIFFDVQEVEETKAGKVNESGYLYVGRKYKDKEVIWIKLKECKKKLTKKQGSDTSAEPKSTSPQ